ncbi:MAG: hypothetical protein UU98_C0011G0010 [Parcubacteria group bacterium GW2011_GWD2_42_14]|nr:MAG: hypothetical protein UU98_C0011G0010 [Parcubacteria group bacterium GW2011_GWD2_42_14]
MNDPIIKKRAIFAFILAFLSIALVVYLFKVTF